MGVIVILLCFGVGVVAGILVSNILINLVLGKMEQSTLKSCLGSIIFFVLRFTLIPVIAFPIAYVLITIIEAIFGPIK